MVTFVGFRIFRYGSTVPAVVCTQDERLYWRRVAEEIPLWL